MKKPKNLYGIVGSKAVNAYDRLKELQSQGISVNPIPFSNWRDWCSKSNTPTELSPNYTIFFSDGWDRYTDRVKGQPAKPVFELYVAGHNIVYTYSLKTSLIAKLVSLEKNEF
jgi:hypothetical protein